MMKYFYTAIFSLLITTTMQSQTYEFSISYAGINAVTDNYQMVLLATPSESVTNNSTDDMGAGFYVPAGVTLGNFVTGNSNLPASEWTSESLSNTSNAFFIYRVEAGANTILLNGAGPFELVFFDIIADPNPTSGEIVFVENGDPVFDELLFIENYMNIAANNLYSNNSPAASSVSFSTLTTQEFIDDSSISIYPNPASEVLNIATDLQIIKVTLFNVLGKKVMEPVNSKRINVNSLSTGIYLLKVETEKGSLTKRISIEH